MIAIGDERFLTVEDLADLLGKKVNTIHKMTSLRQGPPRIRMGRRLYFREKSALEWMLSLETQSGEGLVR